LARGGAPCPPVPASAREYRASPRLSAAGLPWRCADLLRCCVLPPCVCDGPPPLGAVPLPLPAGFLPAAVGMLSAWGRPPMETYHVEDHTLHVAPHTPPTRPESRSPSSTIEYYRGRRIVSSSLRIRRDLCASACESLCAAVALAGRWCACWRVACAVRTR